MLLTNFREFLPVKDCIIWRPVYQFAIQIHQLASVWWEYFLEKILKQIAILILRLTLTANVLILMLTLIKTAASILVN